MTRALAGAMLLGLIAGCTATPSAPSASPAAIVSPTPLATPLPTPSPTAPPSPASGVRHVNPVLGYSVAVPAPWRVSECLSGLIREGTFVGYDTLTTRTVAEEHDLGGVADTGGSGALTWVITIHAEITSKTPAEYKTAMGGGINDKIETTTIDGRAALRIDSDFSPLTYLVASAGRMYAIALRVGHNPNEPQPTAVTAASFDAIARSVTFMTPIARPTPTPMPQLSRAVETVVDAVAAAFAASDADRLRELMPPPCWFFSAGYASSGTNISREKFADLLKTSFAQGRTVTVEARPIKSDAPYVRGPFWVWSTWSAYGSAPFTPQTTVQLVFDQIDGRWYWIGALFNAESLRRP